MKLRVCVSFDDKNTGETYPVGAEIEVSESRAAEILAHPLGLAEVVEEELAEVVEEELAEVVEEEKPQKSASRGRKRGAGK